MLSNGFPDPNALCGIEINMKKALIVNADDLGLTDKVSLGIEKSYLQGIVSSASIMANTAGFSEGVQVALRNPGLGVGIHLNIIRGWPLGDTEQIHPLLDNDGRFISNMFHIGRLAANRDFLKAAEIEYRLQIERVLDSGIKPDHLDFEKHHGIWKNLYQIGQNLAREYKLALRSYHEPLLFVLQNLPFPGYNKVWKALHLKCYETVFHRKTTAPTPDYFFGQTHIGRINRDFLLALVRNLPDGVSEIMTHPGYNLPENFLEHETGNSWINNLREAEMNALCDTEVSDLLHNSGIKVTTFREGLLHI